MHWITLIICAAVASFGPHSDNHQALLRRLTSDEITSALRGRIVSYSPPGWSDAGVQEEYDEDGGWTGMRFGRGPFPFSGSWTIRKDQLCVRAEKGLTGDKWQHGWVCRKVWMDSSGKLLMAHMIFGLSPQLGLGPLELSIRVLSN